MRKVKGAYNTAKIYTNTVEESAISQIKMLCDRPEYKQEKIRIMPDVHSGTGCVIGTTMTLHGKIVCPSLVGVDIGCGVMAVNLGKKPVDLDELDKTIRQFVPYGRNIHSESTPKLVDFENYLHSRNQILLFNPERSLELLQCPVDKNRARLSLGTLGGGNHFIELDKRDNGDYVLVVHTGSRHMGLEIAKYYQNLAKQRCARKESKEIIDFLKDHDLEALIQDALDLSKKNTIPSGMEYLSGNDFKDYMIDMSLAQDYAEKNRILILEKICCFMKRDYTDYIETVHNYIDGDILRKGSVSAKAGERILIPMNMRDGTLICEGLGNEDWNFSAPHDAGRMYSRTKAKSTFTVDQFKDSMEGIYSTTLNKNTLDESPMAYKNMYDIMDNIKDTARVIEIMKPVYNFKADN